MLQQKSTFITPRRVRVSSEAQIPASTHSLKRARRWAVVGPADAGVLLFVGEEGRKPVCS
jgi:hypothetical protein